MTFLECVLLFSILDQQKRVNNPFKVPTIEPRPRKVPSPTFARFNPGLVCPPNPSQSVNQATITIMINNYYGGARTQPQYSDPTRMSRCQLKR